MPKHARAYGSICICLADLPSWLVGAHIDYRVDAGTPALVVVAPAPPSVRVGNALLLRACKRRLLNQNGPALAPFLLLFHRTTTTGRLLAPVAY